MDRRDFLKKSSILAAATAASLAGCATKPKTTPVEIRDYQGERLDKFYREYDNSIRGPQKVDKYSYRLNVSGLCEKQLILSYNEILALPHFERVITLYCTEGWKQTWLFEGFLMTELMKQSRIKDNAKVVIMYAADGYSTSLPVDYMINENIMVATKINGLRLDSHRGFPIRLVAEDKIGYKWIKWMTDIRFSQDTDFRGYWEQRGYPNDPPVGDTSDFMPQPD